ncbi:MAG: hypothetical protein Ct9H300mP18_00400 [Candidatus Neomarinimicrobiota bacterium]|jgi:hypothetical protein|nr:MAG: hypothetical protein CM1200mP1_00200 [Candidatus Neomarinimicrobiota bacterium]GIT56611.1 MAG: hypothetical protein Ct9H300mP18_00400 [Candidatus Neomarinimicrobiota bacterium]|tara:strand:+ start:263 stop:517 length:255 start_codon:yes stop_codon:yes gene_type:complete
MELLQSFDQLITNWIELNPGIFSILIIVLSVWEAIWTLLGLWFAARQNQKIWFLLMGILQVVGIIEIIYLATQTRFFKNFNLND